MRIFARRLMLLGAFPFGRARDVGRLGHLSQGSGIGDPQRRSRSPSSTRFQSQQQQLTASIGELQTERGKEAALRQRYNVGNAGGVNGHHCGASQARDDHRDHDAISSVAAAYVFVVVGQVVSFFYSDARARLVQWQNECFPSIRRGSESLTAHQ